MYPSYDLKEFYDEMLEEKDKPRDHYVALCDTMKRYSIEELGLRHQVAQQDFLRQGITFTVYSDETGTERTMPFDFMPRVIPQDEWVELRKGLVQRIKALEMFLDDIYGDQNILNEGVVPRDLIVTSADFCHPVAGISQANQRRIFLAGVDLIRDDNGKYLVLEDNLRNPSGLAYVFQNRYVMRKVFPEFFNEYSVQSLEHQFYQMLVALESTAPKGRKKPNVVLLTPGIYNSAYFEHSFLAKQMGIPLVEGRDLIVRNRVVYMKTTRGLQRVDVIYRRIDDPYLDPLEFKHDSLLGVPGIIDCMRAGNVSVANGLGNGVADDKATYAFVPDMIKYYLNEEPLLDNVPTYLLKRAEDCDYVLKNIEKMVVKDRNSSGGYNMLIGPKASTKEIEAFRERIRRHPENYIAQPTISLSRAPAYRKEGYYGCHVDLRAYVIGHRDQPQVFPGGLTRVALKEGSLVVNSSQGGGGKDTWVLA